MYRICVTNRHLVRKDYIEQLHAVLSGKFGEKPDALILREKDMTEEEYLKLAQNVMHICEDNGVRCIIHNYVHAAKALQAEYLHLSYVKFIELMSGVSKCSSGENTNGNHASDEDANNENASDECTLDEYIHNENLHIGTSIHSVEDAVQAEKLGAAYVTAGHIYTTDCKKGLEPRGTCFLAEVCENVSIPVYAIGGINECNAKECIKAGAAGVCIMSGYMR